MKSAKLLIAAFCAAVNSATAGLPTDLNPLGSTAYYPNVTSGLIAWWRLDESNQVSVVTDIAGTNQGTLFNGVNNHTIENSFTGVVRNSLKFDGVNDYVKCGSNIGINYSTNQFSVSFWIKPIYTGYRFYIGNCRSDHDQRGWCVFSYAERLYLQIKVGDVSQQTELQCSASIGTVIMTTTWCHVVVTYSGSRAASGVKLYVNNTNYPSLATDLGTLSIGNITTSREVSFGAAQAGEHPYTGWMDDVRIYNRVLSASEVAVLYAWREK